MTKEEIWEKLDLEIRLRGLSRSTFKRYKCAIGIFLDWVNKPYEEVTESDFRNYLIYLVSAQQIPYFRKKGFRALDSEGVRQLSMNPIPVPQLQV